MAAFANVYIKQIDFFYVYIVCLFQCKLCKQAFIVVQKRIAQVCDLKTVRVQHYSCCADLFLVEHLQNKATKS